MNRMVWWIWLGFCLIGVYFGKWNAILWMNGPASIYVLVRMWFNRNEEDSVDQVADWSSFIFGILFCLIAYGGIHMKSDVDTQSLLVMVSSFVLAGFALLAFYRS